MASGECYEPEPRKPRLIWSGREARRVAEALPSQVVEIVFPQHADVKDLREWQALRREEAQQSRLPGMRAPQQLMVGDGDGAERADLLPANRLIWTNDNLVALTSLLHGDDQHPPLAGKVDLIYIDPPFAVQSDFLINVPIENGVTDEKMPTLIEELAYTDTWKNGLDSYLSMMRDRLNLLNRLLSPSGSIYVHCDAHASHYVKILMDEVIGYENFRNEIVWKRADPKGHAFSRFPSTHDVLLYYGKTTELTWETQYTEYDESYLDSHYSNVEERTGRRYTLGDCTNPNPDRPNLTYEWN